MAPPAALTDLDLPSAHDIGHILTKRAKLDLDQDDCATLARHPLGIRPAGNALLSETNAKSQSGTFARFPDELITVILEYLPCRDLLLLGATCRALFAFTHSDELWRALFIESSPASFTWRGTWRATFLGRSSGDGPVVDCSALFSDVLHRPYFCTHVSLRSYVSSIPQSNQILRLDDCGPDTVFEADRPLILTAPARRWPVFSQWSIETFLRDYKDVRFRAEAVDWPLRTYVDYMRDNTDESPLYLFDRAFAEKMKISVADSARSADRDCVISSESANTVEEAYWPPACFGSDQDLFSVLGERRPDHRWLIIGPARSGSTFHRDPNNTCAWNAVIRGSKYWIMFPSSSGTTSRSALPPPPGVIVNEDESEVTCPLSIAEWLLTFHAQARATPGCKEGICDEGELLYVPAGWFHLVLNLEESIALTQNFVPRHGLADVQGFLRDRPEQVTGFRDVHDPYGLFVEKLREKEPELLDEAVEELDKRAVAKSGGRGKWQELVGKRGNGAADNEGETFAFGFGDGDDDHVP